MAIQQLAKQRDYIIVVAFAIGMLLTPPDVFSQSLLAIAMWLLWLLFEFGVIMSKVLIKSDATPRKETPPQVDCAEPEHCWQAPSTA